MRSMEQFLNRYLPVFSTRRVCLLMKFHRKWALSKLSPMIRLFQLIFPYNIAATIQIHQSINLFNLHLIQSEVRSILTCIVVPCCFSLSLSLLYKYYFVQKSLSMYFFAVFQFILNFTIFSSFIYILYIYIWIVLNVDFESM